MKDYIKNALKSSMEHLIDNYNSQSNFIHVERSRSKEFGDYSSNIALSMLKLSNYNSSQEFAKDIVNNINLNSIPMIKKTEVADNGFINFFIDNNAYNNLIIDIIKEKENYGKQQIGGDKNVILEFVSANPTGPLHVGHGRGAVFGSVVANLLSFIGYKVHCEYLINDVGRQIDILAVSVWLRYLEICGMKLDFPSNGYNGSYIKEISEKLFEEYDNKLNLLDQHKLDELIEKLEEEDDEKYIDRVILNAKNLLKDAFKKIKKISVDTIMIGIKNDLSNISVEFNTWFSENEELHETNNINIAIEEIGKKELTYEKDGCIWFTSTKFGDDKDRVLVRTNKQSTYFASDVAYHKNKVERGFDIIINVFGADHHGYTSRVSAAAQAFGCKKNNIIFPIVQFATLFRGKEKMQMSTRSGEFVTLKDLTNEIGKDATRFFYSMKKIDHHMNFDINLAKSKSNNNLLYYIQYSYARICSIFKNIDEKNLTFNQNEGEKNLNLLTTELEKKLISHLVCYKETIVNSAKKMEPQHIVMYLKELSNLFHSYYTESKIIIDSDNKLMNARLYLILSVKQILSNCLGLLGVSSPESM